MLRQGLLTQALVVVVLGIIAEVRQVEMAVLAL
jgi:hypothetical protein